ncbi:hypothetical protein B9Q06_11285 [Candidatus Marsarchaeota G2 archaeon ECH_B_2]|uniref:ABC transporter domain-containing protein n=2 Tax=Candidatus Marsarchaeota group 2 TaxID=2203771 RepID=A0A2R6B4X7_9ARCH|nr:MAG: hypothetical protein B9Q06_11285 [Candidatus Marsarchaeota G2 archaeon ECH_B_2]PSO02342.1 MAG: hypothetical protein B9Q05_05685 [Candidatus Marsarchaeota G2 archaeon ECH_B_1]
MAEVVVFESAVKDYGSKRIGPVTLRVGRSEVMGLVGPNGSGKTTTIRLMLGLIRPSSGLVLVNGYPPHSRRVEALSGVGYSPELPNLPTFFTPRELLRLVGGELGVDPSKDGVDEVLERVGLLAYSDTKIGKLSKGMVQRLSIAQALMGNPQTLVLDEPLIGVDPLGADHLRKMLADFASKGGSVILSSHQLPEVEGLCTSVTAFRRGGVMFSGRVSELVGRVLGELTVRVEAIGLERNVIDKIRTLDGVLEVEENPKGLRVRVKADRELRPIIARTLIEEGCELREIGYLNNTLEELYRRVVGGDASGEG